MRDRRHALCAALLLSASMLPVAGAQAQSVSESPARTETDTPAQPQEREQDPSQSTVGISDIIVTATRQGATSQQRTPLAIAVVSGAAVDKQVLTDVRDLVQLTPNITVSQNTASAQIYIRGVGTNNVLNGSDPDVAVQIDGVYIARAFGQFADFYDIDRIEVLRGPQGTLYGRNAVGGVINIISRLPSDRLDIREQVTVGTYGTIQNQTVVSGPLIPGLLSASVSGNYVRHNGYIKNIVASGEDDNSADHGGLRGQLRLQPSRSLDVVWRGDWSKAGENTQASNHLRVPAILPYTSLSITRPALLTTPLADSLVGDYFRTAHDRPNVLRERNWGVSQDATLTLGDVTLRSLTAYRDSFYRVDVDTDATEQDVQFTTQQDHSRQISQEFNLNVSVGPINLVAGLYYFNERQNSLVISRQPPQAARPASAAILTERRPFTEATSQAAFAQASIRLAEGLKLTLGGRYTKDTKSFDANQNRYSYANAPALGPLSAGYPSIYHVTTKFDAFTPRIGVDWQLTPEALFYASYSKGFKSGGNNDSPCLNNLSQAAFATCLASIVYRPERIQSYEVGLKTTWFDRRLTANLTGFYYNYADLQVNSQIGGGVVMVNNAADARNKGVELELQARPTPRLLLTANAAYLDAHYQTFASASVPNALRYFVSSLPQYNAATNTYNASGNQLNNAPKVQLQGSARYGVPVASGEVYVQGSAAYQARSYFDPSNVSVMSQAPYTVANLALGYDSDDGKWTAVVQAKNLFNKGYFITTYATSLVPAGVSGTPRVVVLRVARRF